VSTGQNERRNRQVFLKKVPTGIAGPDDFEVKESVVASIGDGEVLVESHYLGLDAALRLIVRDSDEFLFRVRPVGLSSQITRSLLSVIMYWLQAVFRTSLSAMARVSNGLMLARRHWVHGLEALVFLGLLHTLP